MSRACHGIDRVVTDGSSGTSVAESANSLGVSREQVRTSWRRIELALLVLGLSFILSTPAFVAWGLADGDYRCAFRSSLHPIAGVFLVSRALCSYRRRTGQPGVMALEALALVSLILVSVGLTVQGILVEALGAAG